MARVLIGASSFGAVDAAPIERLREAGFDVQRNPFGRKLKEQDLIDLLPGVVGLIAGLEPLTARVLEGSALRAISRSGVGMSNVDLQAAQRLGITVRNTPGVTTTAVAELTLAAMLELLRRLSTMNRDLHEGRWTRVAGVQLEGKTVAVIGYGLIGRRVASLLLAFGARVVAVDPDTRAVDQPVRLASLADALRVADIVSLHASGDATILGPAEFAQMKTGVLVLNAARGGLVDEAALCGALESGQVGSAWLDAFVQEPYEGSLTRFPQVLLTPHVGSYTRECRRVMEMTAAENLIEALGAR